MREFIIKFDTDKPLSEIASGTTVRGMMKVTGDCDEIIRCKDCRHRPKRIEEDGSDGFNLEFPDDRCPCHCEDGWYNWMPADDWFCGNGERREEWTK